uniref:Uncharacterized protein n=1 Tax=Caenorhabditis japonica TaxID=281687 RepID=A0A8R1EL19_CAEJA
MLPISPSGSRAISGWQCWRSAISSIVPSFPPSLRKHFISNTEPANAPIVPEAAEGSVPHPKFSLTISSSQSPSFPFSSLSLLSLRSIRRPDAGERESAPMREMQRNGYEIARGEGRVLEKRGREIRRTGRHGEAEISAFLLNFRIGNAKFFIFYVIMKKK